jgi:hypothetical protein
MSYVRARPASHWVDFPDITYGTVGSAEFGKWDTALEQIKGSWLDIRDFGAVGDGVTDDAAALTAALPAAGSMGATIIVPPGTWTWKSVPALPKGITGRLLIRGFSSKIVLSSSGSRFLDCVVGADYDTFQNIEVDGFVVDCNNIGGTGHVIFGNRIDAVSDQRVNFQSIVVRNCRATNVPVTSGGRAGVAINCHHPSASEATQTSVKDILFENVRVEGGAVGFELKANKNPFDITVPINHFFDRIRIIGCWHSCLSPQASGTFANIQIAQNGYGGSVTIRDFYGAYSGDVGIEIDAPTSALVENAVIENATNASFLVTNFRAPDKPNAQRWHFEGCRSVCTDSSQGIPSAWMLKANNSVALGSVSIVDCGVHRDAAGAKQGDVIATNGFVTCRRLQVDGLTANIEAGTFTGNLLPLFISNLKNGLSPTLLGIRRSSIRVTGARGASNVSVDNRVVGISNIALSLDGLDLDFNVTGINGNQASAIYGLAFHLGTTVTLIGTIRRLHVLAMTDDPAPFAIRFGSTTTNPVGARGVLIDDCDFFGVGVSNSEVRFSTVPQNQDKVRIRNAGTYIYPKPSAAMSTTNFAAATFTTGVGNQYVGCWDADIHFANGTGAAVTKIEASKDGTTYEEMWNQASGAMAQDVLVPVETGDYIKATFATTQPTTRVRYHR